MFKRETGFTTAYIGLSNLSNPAVTSGLEWNMKVTEKDSFDIIRKFEATFESYWNDGEFIVFDGDDDNKNQLKRALKKDSKEKNDFNFILDIHPTFIRKRSLKDFRQSERSLEEIKTF